MDQQPAPKPTVESPPQSPLSQVSDTRDVTVLFETPLNAEMISSFIAPPEEFLEPHLLAAAPAATSGKPSPVPASVVEPQQPQVEHTEPHPREAQRSPIIEEVVGGAAPAAIKEDTSHTVVVARQSSLPQSPLIAGAPAAITAVLPAAVVPAVSPPATPSSEQQQQQQVGFNQAQFEADMALLKQLPPRDDAAVAGVTRMSTHVGTIYHRGTGVKVRLTNTIDYVMDEENLVKLMKRGHVAVYDTKDGTLLTEYKGFKLPTIDQLITNVVEYHTKEPQRRVLLQ